MIYQIFEIQLFIIFGPVLLSHKMTMPAPYWLDGSAHRALHRYRRSHSFEYRSSLNFSQASFRNCVHMTAMVCHLLILYVHDIPYICLNKVITIRVSITDANATAGMRRATFDPAIYYRLKYSPVDFST